jgi:hypothetical protein
MPGKYANKRIRRSSLHGSKRIRQGKITRDAYTPIHQALGVLGAWQFAQNTPLKLTLRMVKQAVEQHNPPADAQPDFAPVYGLDDLVAHYEFADKMREINLKRQVVGLDGHRAGFDEHGRRHHDDRSRRHRAGCGDRTGG